MRMKKATLATMGWEIMNCPSYGPDLAPRYSFVWTIEGAPRRTEISN
jgi:hypothetical protein